jgi:hypothetical protein
LAPLVAQRVATGFNDSREAMDQCPGESACERFLTSAGSNQRERAANACTGCELLPTKITAEPGVANEWLWATVERVRRERDSGGGIDLSQISATTWQLVQCWDQIELKRERARARDLHQLSLELLLGRV